MSGVEPPGALSSPRHSPRRWFFQTRRNVPSPATSNPAPPPIFFWLARPPALLSPPAEPNAPRGGVGCSSKSFLRLGLELVTGPFLVFFSCLFLPSFYSFLTRPPPPSYSSFLNSVPVLQTGVLVPPPPRRTALQNSAFATKITAGLPGKPRPFPPHWDFGACQGAGRPPLCAGRTLGSPRPLLRFFEWGRG